MIITLSSGCGAPTQMASSFSINSFTGNPTTIAIGDKAVLSWSVSGATSVSIDNGVGSVTSSGSIEVQPKKDTMYTLTAGDGVNSAKTTVNIMVKGGTSATAKAKAKTPTTVAAPPPANLPVVNFFMCTPALLDPGGTTTLKWDVSNSTYVTIKPLVGPSKPIGMATVKPDTSTVYTLTASNYEGSVTARTTVMLRCKNSILYPVILWFTANPEIVVENNSTTLSWSIFGATSENFSPVDPDLNFGSDVARITALGTRTIVPTENDTYTITAANTNGVTTTSVTLIKVLNDKLPVIKSFNAMPMTIVQGNPTILSWEVYQADTVTLNGEAVGYVGTRVIAPASSRTYTLALSNSEGNISKSVTVTVLAYNSKYFMPLVSP